MDRRLYVIFTVLLVVLIIGRELVGSPQPLTIWDVWDSLRGK